MANAMTQVAALAPQLDFESLLSRGYRPANVTQLIPRDKYQPDTIKNKKKKKSIKKTTDATTATGYNLKVVGDKDEIIKLQHEAMEYEITSRLVLKLVTQTPAFRRHLPEEIQQQQQEQAAGKDIHLLLKELSGPKPPRPKSIPELIRTEIPPAFHEVELGDWESQINWKGCVSDDEDDEDNNDNNTNDDDETKEKSKKEPIRSRSSTVVDDENTKIVPSNRSFAQELLERRRNPFLDNLILDETTVSWTGDTDDLLEKANNAPLILEFGVAGRSVGRHVYQNAILSAQRPASAVKSDAYRARVEREWAKQQPANGMISPDDVVNASKGSLHLDKEKMQALIEAKQRKRAQMAEDKKDRVADAMGTMALGGGRGRTVTSSLMGPGGTERTGRPSRNVAVGGAYETVYIEQLDLVNTHALYRDLSKVMLREYLRPKLPYSVVRQGLVWQFQHRYIPANKKDVPGAGGAGAGAGGTGVGSQGGQTGVSGSYLSTMMGSNNFGAISKERIRAENDLSPTEGKLVVFEYCEERPPIQLTKGMCSKIINYYRGDRARCPVSAGGGDRPARRRRVGEGQEASKLSSKSNDRLPRLEGPNRDTTVMDWVGKIPKKTQKERAEKETIDMLPEGVTEILHPKVHGPFIGEIEQGTTLTGLVSNLFFAPLFKHEPESTDFLMVLSPIGGASRPGQREMMGVVLRDLPESIFTVGQTEPRVRVHAPNTQGEKSFIGPFVSYQIACCLRRSQDKDGHGLRFDELQDRVLPSSDLPANALRQRLKQVAVYDKNTQIWTTKPIGFEDYPGVDALAKSISPEGVATFETSCAARRRLIDLGIQQLLEKGSHTVVGVGVTMGYLAGQVKFAFDAYRTTKRMRDLSKNNANKGKSTLQLKYYEKATEELEEMHKMYKQKNKIAQFIYEELQLAPWHLTGEFIDIHKKSEGTGMMKLTGLGDPSGLGEGFSFLRQADTKPSKSVGANSQLNAEIKKITGTDDDLRKLTMKQMAKLLLSYGMGQKQIDGLKRWDRVHVIRDLSTKAASDGIGDGLERFARDEKLKLSEQKQMYTERIQVIWKRQIAALSAAGDRAIGLSDVAGNDHDNDGPDSEAASAKKDTDRDDSDSDSSVDSLAADFEEEFLGGSEANQLVAAHTVGNIEREGGLGQLRAAAQNQEMTSEARQYAALLKQREEERAAREGLQSARVSGKEMVAAGQRLDRKVIRRKITKTYPDGRQTTIFKFILHPKEVDNIITNLNSKGGMTNQKKELKYKHAEDESPPGHVMFEDEDDFEYSSKGRHHSGALRKGGAIKIRRGAAGRVTPRGSVGGAGIARNLTLGKLKTKTSKEERMKKRKREEEEMEVYASAAKRKGTSNRRERGSIRDRRPHVIFAEKLEQIRNAVEARPYAGPFLKPVNRRLIPRYYEVISHPIDLSTIRDKIKRYEYRTANALVKDFELMKNNAVKFNGTQNQIAEEAVEIYKFVMDQVEASRAEFSPLEQEVEELMSGKLSKQVKGSKKKVKFTKGKKSSGSGGTPSGDSSMSNINIGDISQDIMDDDVDASDTDSDDDDDILDLDI